MLEQVCRLVLDFNGLAAVIETTLAADAVRQLRRATARALVRVLGRDLVLRPALVRARVTLFLLWDGHNEIRRLLDAGSPIGRLRREHVSEVQLAQFVPTRVGAVLGFEFRGFRCGILGADNSHFGQLFAAPAASKTVAGNV